MKNKILILILILAHSVVSATEKTWDGGGGNSNWGNAANWNSDVLPGSTDNVTIGTGVSVTMTADYTTTGTITLTGTGTIQMAGYNLTIGGLTGSVGSIINNSGTSKNLTLNQSTWTTFSGSITGNISLIKNGTYSLTLSGANSFNGGSTINSGFIDIANDGTLTQTLQAESWSNQSGISNETCSDAGGGQDVGSINSGDWMSYNAITIPATGDYVIQYRVASPSSTGVISFERAGSSVLGTIAVPNTGGWQTWTTISHTISLTAGSLSIGINASTGGFNLNWISISPVINTSLGTGTISIASGSVAHLWAPSAITVNNNFVLNGSTGNSDYPTINHDGGSGLVTLNGTITLNNNSEIGLRLGSSNDMVINGVISGSGALTIYESQNGTSKKLTLNATNTYSGATNIASGTLILGAAGVIPDGSAVSVSGILDLNGKSETVGSIAGTGSITNTSGTSTYTLTTGGNNTSTTFGGIISNVTGTLALTKTGSGTLTLSGNNTFAGNINFPSGGTNDGKISVTHNNGLGSGIKDLNMPGNNASTQELELSNGITVSNVTIKTASRTSPCKFLTNLSGNNTWNGDISITNSGGSTFVESVSGTLTLAGTIQNSYSGSRILQFKGDGNITISGNIIDGTSSLQVTKSSGIGTLTLSGTNTYTGLTTITEGTLKLSSTSALGSTLAGTSISSGAALNLNGINYSNAEALSIEGTGYLSSGVIFNSNATAAIFAGSVTLLGASTIKTDHQITLSGTISNIQDFTKAGSNVLLFSNNTVSVNNLAITAGTLNGASSTINISGDFTSVGTFIPSTNAVVLMGSLVQSLPAVSFNNVTISNNAGVNLTGNISVGNTITLTSGILNTGVYTIDLGNTGTIVEATPNTTSPTSYVTGAVKATRTLMRNINNIFGGIGVELTDANLDNNSTVVIRTTGNGCTGNGKTSIKRYFTITPNVDAGLNGTMVFRYFDSEITGHTEASLKIFKSIDNRIHWSLQNSTNDVANNKMTLTGITSFSDWTASDAINNSLPIVLKTFTAKKYSEKVNLSWTTASETNNDIFSLERSFDGNNWISISNCNGAGTSSKEHQYTYTDYNPLIGMSYYRLKQIDFDGEFTYSGIKSVDFSNDSISIQIFPLPAKAEEINITINSFKGETVTIEIFDALGREISSGKIEVASSQISIKLTDICPLLNPGTYYVIISNENYSVGKKILVEL